MAYLNKIQIIGNVGQEPRIFNGRESEFATFSVAVTKRYKDATGETLKRTTWFSVTVNGKQVATVKQYVHQGTALYIEGEMQLNEYVGNDGAKRTSWELRASNIQLLSSPAEQQSRPAPAPRGANDNVQEDLPF